MQKRLKSTSANIFETMFVNDNAIYFFKMNLCIRRVYFFFDFVALCLSVVASAPINLTGKFTNSLNLIQSLKKSKFTES